MAVSRHRLGLEHRLLISCCGPIEGNRDDLRRLLSRDPDWDVVVSVAEWHRISPLVYRTLTPGLAGFIPDRALQHFEAAYYTTAARSALYERELATVLQILLDSEIPVLRLKGSALLDSAYSDQGLRSMSDLDLLVPAARIEEAERSLGDHGWRVASKQRGDEKMRESFRHIPGLSNPDQTAMVELHRELVSPPLKWDVEAVWDRAHSTTPASEDLLAHVALHFFMDRHEPRPGALRQLVDLTRIPRAHPSLDWNLLFAEAERCGVIGPVSCGLWAAHELFEMPVPDWVLDCAGFDPVGAEAFIEQRVLGIAAWPLHGLVAPEEDYSPMRLLRNVSRRVFPTRRYLDSRYGDSSKGLLWWWLYHLRDLARRWRGSISRPGIVRRGLLADRWLHSMIDRESPQLTDR